MNVVWLATYTATVSIAFAVLSVLAPQVAAPLLVGFVALLLVPACVNDIRRARRRRDLERAGRRRGRSR